MARWLATESLPSSNYTEVILNSTYDLQSLYKPSLNLKLLGSRLKQARWAVDYAGLKTKRTSRNDRLDIA